MTASNGCPIDTKTASMTIGPRGPIVLQDFTLVDELAHFDRERIPERVVHAKGAGKFTFIKYYTQLIFIIISLSLSCNISILFHYNMGMIM